MNAAAVWNALLQAARLLAAVLGLLGSVWAGVWRVFAWNAWVET